MSSEFSIFRTVHVGLIGLSTLSDFTDYDKLSDRGARGGSIGLSTLSDFTDQDRSKMIGGGYKAPLTVLSCLAISVLGQGDRPCPGQSTCTVGKHCQLIVELRKLKGTDDAEYRRRLPEIKKLICNKKERKVCCPRSKNDPFSPSWLPSVEKHSCGAPHGTAFIVGGENTNNGEFPWTVLAGRKANGTVSWYCGGSLINRWYVVTAAHCAQPDVVRVGEWRVVVDTKPDTDHELVFSDKQLTSCRRRNRPCRNFHLFDSSKDCVDDFGKFVYSGEQANAHCGPPHQDLYVDGYTKHPQYRRLLSGVLVNDIALVKLEKPVRLANEGQSNVSPICLPIPGTIEGSPMDIGEPGSGIENAKGVVVGWGRTYNATDRISGNNRLVVESATQKKLKIPFISNARCREEVHRDIRAEYHLCGGGVLGKDSCNGDSGGPLIYRVNSNSPFQLVGAVSFGTRICGIGTPAVFTRITSYVDWIIQNLT